MTSDTTERPTDAPAAADGGEMTRDERRELADVLDEHACETDDREVADACRVLAAFSRDEPIPSGPARRVVERARTA